MVEGVPMDIAYREMQSHRVESVSHLLCIFSAGTHKWPDLVRGIVISE